MENFTNNDKFSQIARASASNEAFEKVYYSKKEIKMELLEMLDEIAKDMENDAALFEGKPFNGKTIGTYFGNQGAAIAALAKAIKLIVKRLPK